MIDTGTKRRRQLSRAVFWLLSAVAFLTTNLGHSADARRIYRDRELGFLFTYPASWSEQPGVGRNVRVVITAPAGGPAASCNVVVVRRVPQIAGKTQAELDGGLDGAEFEHAYWLRDMPKNTRVFDARRVTLAQRVARTAVLDFFRSYGNH